VAAMGGRLRMRRKISDPGEARLNDPHVLPLMNVVRDAVRLLEKLEPVLLRLGYFLRASARNLRNSSSSWLGSSASRLCISIHSIC
jgi:hypothetical protein